MSNPYGGELKQDDIQLDGMELLRNTGCMRGDAKGSIVEAPSNEPAVPVSDTRGYSNEPYTPYPSQNTPFPRPNVKPVPTY